MPKDKHQNARVFSVDTRFQRMARRPGAVMREHAIERAQNHIEEIKVGFNDWLNRELKELANLIQRAQAGVAEADWVDLANVHSRQLRDVGTTMDCELITFIADALCEIFDAMAAGAECNFNSIDCHVDALFLARHEPYRHLRPDQVPELTNGLRLVVECVSVAPTGNEE
jgi:hypothetical protein